MHGGVIALVIAGLVAFGAGAYLAASGERPLGVTMMGMGLIFQSLVLRQLRIAKSKDQNDAG